MEKYEGKWSRGVNLDESRSIFGTVEFENGNILVDFGDECILGNTIFTTEIDGEYISVYCDRFLSYGKGKAGRAIISPKNEDIVKLSKVDNKVISEVKFNISNLYWWVGGSGILEEDGRFIFREPIKIMENNIFIETFIDIEEELGGIETIPMINIIYNEPVSLRTAEKDISSITKFFAILIGRIDGVQDIFFKLENNDYLIEYYTATNNTHMTEYDYYTILRRTSYNKLSKDLSSYYLEWCDFYEKYYIVIEHYFNLHIATPLTIESMFTSWCNIYDGYSIHKNETDMKSEELERLIKNYLKENKKLENGIKEILQSLGSKYERKQIGNWFKNGYVIRKTFGDRLKDIFEDNFNLLLKNIEDFKFEGNVNSTDVFRYINATRNYYIHLKEQKGKMLNINQMVQFNRVVNCTFISILLNGIGFEKSEVLEILNYDDAGVFLKIE